MDEQSKCQKGPLDCQDQKITSGLFPLPAALLVTKVSRKGSSCLLLASFLLCTYSNLTDMLKISGKAKASWEK